MTANKPSHLVPKLRFPEFRDGPRWGLLTLSSASDLNPSNDRLPESFIYIDLESVKSSMLIERKEITRDGAPSRAQRLLSRKDIIYQTVRPYQRNNFFFDINDGYEYVASTGYAQIRAHECPEFLYHLLHTDSFVNSVLARCTGSNYPAINPSDLASTPLVLPRKPEQQKIADCLGSLDALIAAEGRKLEVLRQHKQGLMQHLFPQPGETVPRLRFPEFRNATDWKTKILGTQGSFLSSLTGKTAKDFDAGDAAFIPYMNVFSNVFTNTTDLRSVNVAVDESQNAVAVGDVFFTVSSETPEEAGMSSVLLEEIGNCYLNSFCALFRFDEGKSPDPAFLGYLLRSATAREHLSRGAQGATRYNISRATFRSLPILIPSVPEQRKIAGCLGALEDLISAEVGKVDALQQHKQGLLLQLFPSLEGNEQ